MLVSFNCLGCRNPARSEINSGSDGVHCHACGWTRACSADEIYDGRPSRCLVCGCDDLWRQKDFPQGLGLFLVALGAVLSTIAWANYMPRIALGVLLAFALVDLLLYALMKDVLVCYRCGARYRHTVLDADYPRFNLETAERYRQEAARLAKNQAGG